MFYYLYEVRNKLNGKIYVGVHKTENMDDGYMGSGKVIKTAIEKYGIENFTKTILQQFSTEEEMFYAEKQLVNDQFLLREDVYNLRRGGTGGFDYINSSGILKFKGKTHSESSKKMMGHVGNKYWLGKKHSDETKQKIGLKSKIANTGKIKSEETKEKIRKAALSQIRKIIQCPHCGKIGKDNIMPRWHFDNCKKRD
jgi:group I intron endonuclease